MIFEKRRLYASALGIASAFVYLLFNLRRMCGFARDQVTAWLQGETFGSVFLMGGEYVLGDWLTVALYDMVFKLIPLVAQFFFLVWVFGAWLLKRETHLREMIPLYLIVQGFMAYSDCRNIFAPNCYGEAAVFTRLQDAVYFSVFLVHRLSPLLFFGWIWRKGLANTPPVIWCVAAGHGLCVTGLALLHLALFPEANHTDLCSHLVYGVAISFACLLVAWCGCSPMSEICYNTDAKGSLT